MSASALLMLPAASRDSKEGRANPNQHSLLDYEFQNPCQESSNKIYFRNPPLVWVHDSFLLQKVAAF